MTSGKHPTHRGPLPADLADRQQLLELMRASHLKWQREADSPPLEELHRSIAALLGQLIEQYEALRRHLGSTTTDPEP